MVIDSVNKHIFTLGRYLERSRRDDNENIKVRRFTICKFIFYPLVEFIEFVLSQTHRVQGNAI